ncbi:N-acyl-L-homoserine lactone synthetase [Tranquillimonas rosea]|uniref:acyl-homoserine-lactone synthase n=1 Tax=Tranquillimonas rosea TaxID=641238 RepID=A0A1H9X6K6_9RHOB|nr:acyl-homoserine-lactone synthase [Tranquillimonas rosea]SES41754.1 N-acyl-L-homoserine lactone synthetase [Tranquillimonas rosea]
MQTTTLSFANIHAHGELFANMMRARRQLFIEQNKWDLPEALGMEFDQYDTPASRWVVVHDELGQVLAGNRLTPTTAKCGIYSYMIRDAQRGLLETIPSNLLHDEAPVGETIWESSRLFVSQEVPVHLRRPIYAKLVFELGSAVRKLGATQCLTLLNANWPLWAKRVGIDMSEMGPVMEIDGINNQVVGMNFTSTMH